VFTPADATLIVDDFVVLLSSFGCALYRSDTIFSDVTISFKVASYFSITVILSLFVLFFFF